MGFFDTMKSWWGADDDDDGVNYMPGYGSSPSGAYTMYDAPIGPTAPTGAPLPSNLLPRAIPAERYVAQPTSAPKSGGGGSYSLQAPPAAPASGWDSLLKWAPLIGVGAVIYKLTTKGK